MDKLAPVDTLVIVEQLTLLVEKIGKKQEEMNEKQLELTKTVQEINSRLVFFKRK